MGCCCGADEDDEGVDSRQDEMHLKGVVIDRHCTDLPCCCLFFVCLLATAALIVQLAEHSDTRIIFRGRDYEGRFCGEEELATKPSAYYYDIPNRKAVCVERCPEAIGVLPGQTEPGAGSRPIFVPAPTQAVFGRCFPLEAYNESGKVNVCAWPQCTGASAGPATKDPQLRSICAPRPMQAHWLTQAPTREVEAQWRAQGIAEDVVASWVAKWSGDPTALAGQAKKECTIKAEVFTGLRVTGNPNGDLAAFLSRYTSGLFAAARVVKAHAQLIGLLGFVGALVLSLVITTTYTCCLRVALWLSIFVMLLVMAAIDYIFFRKAGWNSGEKGALVARIVIEALGQEAEEYAGVDLNSLASKALGGGADADMVSFYQACAVLWSLAIVGVLCILCAIARQIRTAVALVKEASQCLLQMPSMLVFPYVGVISMALTSVLLLHSLVAVMTLLPRDLDEYLQLAGVENHEELASFRRIQEVLCFLILFSYLWVYFFHVAVFTSVIANCVTNWYFYRDDEDSEYYVGRGSSGYFFGRPIVAAFLSICRYDLGTLAFGSFLIAVATMPRLVLEYVDRQLKSAAQDDPVVRLVMRATKCCLWCFERCIKFLTEYAIINNAVTGKAFCSAARASFALIAKYPVQLALNNFMTGILILVSCCCIPGVLVSLSYLLVEDGWGIVAAFILALSMGVTRISVGVFEVAASTIFVCAMHDNECFGGQHAPPAIAAAMGLKPAAQAGGVRPGEVEMADVDGS